MLTTAELQALAKQTAQIVRSATEPLLARIAELEQRQPQKGEKGDPGPGPDETLIKALVEAHVRQIQPVPGPKGDAGERGPAGADGRDGADAEVDYDVLAKCLDESVARKSAEFELVLERRFNDVLRGFDARVADAVKAIPVPKDGKDGANGKDGLSAENFQREYIGETHEIRETWTVPGSDVKKSLTYPAGGIRPAGYWKDRTAAKAGEAWTHEGTLWIAMRDTSDKPSTESKDWVIGARKGRDGVAKPVKL